jgi:beta-glucosidase
VSAEFPHGFLWGAATSAHQIEGNNSNSDWWEFEHSGHPFVTEPSGDGADSYHRWAEDMDLLAGAGFTDYRFSIEWARIEPAPGEFSGAELAHYRRMIDGAVARGLRPLVTLQHFTVPRWFADRGGWAAPDAVERFVSYVEATAPVVGADVRHVCTINEPYLVSLFPALQRAGADAAIEDLTPDPAVTDALINAHQKARVRLKELHPHLQVGWSIASQDFQPEPGAEQACVDFARLRETVFLEASRADDWVGVQSYTRSRVGFEDGVVVKRPAPVDSERTLMGWEYYPPAVGEAVRIAAAFVGDVPIIVTENGIATADDSQRIAYTTAALASLAQAMKDGVDVRGYFHWSLLDNYEWGRYAPTFGLVAVDRTSFRRTPKPSLGWLGSLAPHHSPT